jgi:hypothetical protein
MNLMGYANTVNLPCFLTEAAMRCDARVNAGPRQGGLRSANVSQPADAKSMTGLESEDPAR